MKFSVLLFICISIPTAISIPEEIKELAAMLHKTCVEESGVDEALIEKVNSQKVFDDDEKLKCYLMCLMDQTGCMDENGVFDVEAAIAVLPEQMREKAAPIVRLCAGKVGSNNACQYAWLLNKCYLEQDADSYVLI